MRFANEYYQMQEVIGQHFPCLRPAQQRGLTLWVLGTILAHSACQNAVITVLMTLGKWHALRQYLREWLYDGADKAAPCASQIEIDRCFAPLLGWVVSWWQGKQLVLAVDATSHGDRVVALVISVLYRGNAIPIAWYILPANQAGGWMSHFLRLLRLLRPAIPSHFQVLVLADRGLWSPRLWKRIRDLGWHPMLRVQDTITFEPVGQCRQPIKRLVAGEGHGWVGRGIAFKHKEVRRAGTLLVVWAEGQKKPWVVLTDLPPQKVGLWWYGLRVWIELGFRALKGVGWKWHHTRRTDPTRVARHWLVLAVAMIWVLAYGSRVEDAELEGVTPDQLAFPPTGAPAPSGRPRQISVFQLGRSWLLNRLLRGQLWTSLWLRPETWPATPTHLQITYHEAA